MLPQIKIYDIDYEFIISNYTDQRLWGKEWNIFVFKDYVFSISISAIYPRENVIRFEIQLKSKLDIWTNTIKTDIDYYIKNMNIEKLKQLIEAKMKHLVEELEENYISFRDEEYLDVVRNIDNEIEILKDIAETFLDENDINIQEVREAYIDKYVDTNMQTYELARKVHEEKKYSYLTDLYLIIAEITNNKDLKQNVEKSQARNVSELEKEIDEFLKELESEEYKTKMEERLEAI